MRTTRLLLENDEHSFWLRWQLPPDSVAARRLVRVHAQEKETLIAFILDRYGTRGEKKFYTHTLASWPALLTRENLQYMICNKNVTRFCVTAVTQNRTFIEFSQSTDASLPPRRGVWGADTVDEWYAVAQFLFEMNCLVAIDARFKNDTGATVEAWGQRTTESYDLTREFSL